MIVEATAGVTRAKVVIDAPELTVSSPTPIAVRVLTGSVQGAYSMADTVRLNRIAAQIALIRASADVFIATELHEDNEMHRYFAGQLQAQAPEFELFEGSGGNHLLYRSDALAAVRVDNLQMPGGLPLSDFTLSHIATGFEFHVLAVHASEDSSYGSAEAERRAQYAFIAQRAAGLRYVIAAGDWQFSSRLSTNPAGPVLAGAGLTGMQRVALPFAEFNSDDGGAGGRWGTDILTRIPSVVVTEAGGVLAAGASDHYLWIRGTIGFRASAADPSLKLTLTRESSGVRTPVPGAVNVTARSMVITDHAVPLARDVVYTATLSDGSQPVRSETIRLDAVLPLLTDTVTGAVAECWIQSWPERTLETASTIVKVPGRRSPVVLTEVEGLASSSPVLLTATQPQEQAIERLLADGDVLLLRTLDPRIPDAYLATTSRSTRRFSEFKPSSTVRLHTLTAQEIGPEDMTEAGLGETLSNIAAALPGGNLEALAALFPGGSLLDVAANDWTALA